MTVALVRARTASALPDAVMVLFMSGLPRICLCSPRVASTRDAAAAISDPKRNDCVNAASSQPGKLLHGIYRATPFVNLLMSVSNINDLGILSCKHTENNSIRVLSLIEQYVLGIERGLAKGP
jgi:hypothetical protein